jgi:hypothetical protein
MGRPAERSCGHMLVKEPFCYAYQHSADNRIGDGDILKPSYKAEREYREERYSKIDKRSDHVSRVRHYSNIPYYIGDQRDRSRQQQYPQKIKIRSQQQINYKYYRCHYKFYQQGFEMFHMALLVNANNIIGCHVADYTKPNA